MNKSDSEIIELDGWVIWQRKVEHGDDIPLLVMLHGLTGDEVSMSLFSVRIPDNYFVISPRGLFLSPSGGFSWTRFNQGYESVSVGDFTDGIDALNRLLTPANFPNVDLNRLSLLGFSQGAALAFTFAVLFPKRIKCVAGLSAFLPHDLKKMRMDRPLTHKRVYLAHGLKDEIIPIENARITAKVLESMGADIIYCEDDVGHKISADCFRGLGDYFRNCLE